MMLRPKYGCFILYLLLNISPAKAQDSTYDSTVTDTALVAPVEEVKSGTLLDTMSVAPLVSIRKVPDTSLARIKKEDDFWYADVAPVRKKQKPPAQNNGFRISKWVGNLLWVIIIICFVSAIIWFLLSGNIQLFSRRSLQINDPGEPAIPARNIFDIDYEKEISAAVKVGNFNDAVRLQYWRLLALLSKKGLIDFTPERTNSYFVNQLSRTDYYRDFSRLTRHFDYTVYGHFQLSAENYGHIEKEFAAFKHRIDS